MFLSNFCLLCPAAASLFAISSGFVGLPRFQPACFHPATDQLFRNFQRVCWPPGSCLRLLPALPAPITPAQATMISPLASGSSIMISPTPATLILPLFGFLMLSTTVVISASTSDFSKERSVSSILQLINFSPLQ